MELFTVNPLLPISIGCLLGLLGGGGSVLMVPIFVYLFQMDPKVAIASSLMVVSIVSFIGVFPHRKMGNVCFKSALLFIPFALAGTFLGTRLSVFFSGGAQLSLFSMVMATAAYLMLNSKRQKQDDDKEKQKWAGRLPLQGFGIGIITGLVGVGGGFMIVPTLVLLANIPMKKAVGTSLLIISANSLVGFLGYLAIVEIPLNFVFEFSSFMTAGLFIGIFSMKFISQERLKKTFAYFLIVISFFILYQNKATLVPDAIASTFIGE